MKSKSKMLGTALVTGGAKRIGASISIKLAKMGYNLVIHYNNSKQEAEKLQSKIIKDFGVSCTLFNADFTDLNQVNNLIKSIRKKFTDWNLLVNNASVFYKSSLNGINIEEIEKNFSIHLKAPILLSQGLAEHCHKLKLNGNIINMLDRTIVYNNTKYFAYLLSKKSLAAFTKMAALQFAPAIRVNGIAPGFILKIIDGFNLSEDDQALISKNPLGIKCSKKNINQTIKYLLTNKFLTGQILFVDGGASLN